MFKLLPIVFLLASFGLQAEIKELAPGLTVDTSRFVQKIASCGSGIPGEMCIIQCYNVDNKTTDFYYTCNLQAKATFIEQINLTNGGVLYTGNTLTATDYRSVTIYPYQTVSVCFNYGKEVVTAPAQPNVYWNFTSSSITAKDDTGNGCIGGTEGPAEIKP
jgi:hypothetical protein